MIIAIIGYDLRALGLCRILLREKHEVHIIPGFKNETFSNLKYYEIMSLNVPLYEQVREIDTILELLKGIKPDFVICLHIESYDSGLVELLRLNQFITFGINSSCAKLETSKYQGVLFAEKCGLQVPNTTYIFFENKNQWFENFEWNNKIVIKANGLAGGKGTVIVEDKNHLKNVITKISTDFLVQNYIEGDEIALSLLLSGGEVHLINVNFEVKKKYNNDLGENTSGMGTVARNSLDLDTNQIIKLLKNLPKHLFDVDYYGAIDINFIIDKDNNFVFLEFTCRFGDPELNSELLLINNVGELLYNIALNKLVKISYNEATWAVGIVAREIGKLLPISHVGVQNYFIDMLDFGGYEECCVSAYGKNYSIISDNIYHILKNILPLNSHFRTDIDKTIYKRWARFKNAANI